MMRILLPSISNYCMQRNGATRYFNAYFALPSADADDVRLLKLSVGAVLERLSVGVKNQANLVKIWQSRK
jgi:hypothetical protein